MNMQVSGTVVKQLRVKRGWTQEHLAHLAGVSAKTIQRVEKSGICDLETRSALASVLQMNVEQIDGDKKVEQARTSNEYNGLFLIRLTTGGEIVNVFSGAHGYRFSNEDPRSADDADRIASFASIIHDYAEIWEEIDPGSRIRYTFELNESLQSLQEAGFAVFALRTKSKSSFAVATGDKQDIELKIANFHIAYADSAEIVVLDGRTTQCATPSDA